jgi:hypothetical protein
MHTRTDVLTLLTLLENNYGRTFPAAKMIGDNLPLLRALEADGFVRVIRVVLELNWVTTPAGAIWKHIEDMSAQVIPPPLLLDRDVLCAQKFAWMTAADASAAVSQLNRAGYITTEGDSLMRTDAVPGAAYAPRFQPPVAAA